MVISVSDAVASTAQPAPKPLLSSAVIPPPQESVRHVLFGSKAVVNHTIKTLHAKDYAEANDWSPLIPTGRGEEVMSILVKRVPLD
ncbi:MAG: hypothetical protein AAF329_25960 [Cyanobacteria bacterium P01_A01_bin.17]